MERLPKPPTHLSREAKRFWRRVVESYDLDSGGLLLLRTALEAWDRMQEARREIEAKGLVLINPKTGVARQNPACGVEEKARQGFLRAWAQLGLDIEPPGPVGRPAGGVKRYA